MSLQLYSGGKAILPGHRDPIPCDLLVENGILVSVEPSQTLPVGAERIDCTGCILLPGLFDAHVHLREPGREDCETIQSGTEAAIAGGITGLLAMPNTDPPIDTGGMVTFVGNMARTRARIPVSVAGCLTKGRTGEKLAEIADMADQGAVMVTDCNHALQDAYVLRRALEYTRHFDVVVGVFPDTPALSAGGVMNEGVESFRLGLPGIPAMAEEIGIERDLRVAEATRGRIHIQNVSTARGVESIRRFKDRGVQVSAEVTPHHLLLNHTHLSGYNTDFKMMPPLRTEEDQAALLEGLKDGTLDLIATGHAPHTAFEKNMDFRNAPFGVIGLETALLSLYDKLIVPGKLDWGTLVERFANAPRQLFNLEPDTFVPGRKLELVIFDPAGRTSISRDSLRSHSHNTPWLGVTLAGRVRQVVLGNTALLKE